MSGPTGSEWTVERSGDNKWITLTGPEYGQLVEVHNDDVVEDQMPLAEEIARFLNESAPDRPGGPA